LLGKLYDRKNNEWVRWYDDEIPMNFSTLNHISIAFKDDYCLIDLLEKMWLFGILFNYN